MAIQGVGRAETCISHPDRPAAARCARCHKPLCRSCVISTKDGHFCSRECAATTADFRKAYTKVRVRGESARRLARTVFWFAILVVFLGVVNRFLFGNRMPVLGPLLNKLPVLGAESY